jgi:solute carrier family 13 (sodium-dependent dicarboxylate transporter), member 2/3/5
MRVGTCVAAIAAAVLAAVASGGDPILTRTLVLAAVCLSLWLTEVVPPFIPTMVLLGGAPLLLGAYGPAFEFGRVLIWAADPVLVLFFGGFVLGIAAQRHGLDVRVAQTMLHVSRGSARRLVAATLLATAALSMWMSNVAAAAVMIAVLRPLSEARHHGFPARAVFLAVAFGANLGGIATPIGTGPNAIAIAAARAHHRITFVDWMGLALPLTLGMLLVVFMLLVMRHRVGGWFQRVEAPLQMPATRGRAVLGVMCAAIATWLLEPLHGIPAPIVALLLAAVLFSTRLLTTADLGAVDWSTLGLIAGGISLGRLLEAGGVLSRIPQVLHATAGPQAELSALVIAAAAMSALMSNTATAALLIPLASAMDPSPATAVLIAIACSFGTPFAISTPPNAMALGNGGVTSSDLLWIGLPLMVLGCGVLIATGPAVLAWIGIP